MVTQQKDTTLAVLTHIFGIFIGFIGALIVYLVTDKKQSFTKDNAKEALNWQLSAIIYYVISAILVLILIGFLGLFLIYVLNIVYSIIGAVKASQGTVWRYPLTIRFLN